MIVSERGSSLAAMSAKRRSEPSSRIVCGSPGSTSSRKSLTFSIGCCFEGSMNSLSVASTSISSALLVPIAENSTTSSGAEEEALVEPQPWHALPAYVLSAAA